MEYFQGGCGNERITGEQRVMDTAMPTSILVASGDARVIQEIGEHLDPIDHSVVAVAVTRAEAATMAVTARPDVVLLDMRLEESTGRVRSILETCEHNRIPVVYLVTDGGREGISEALMRCAAFLITPFGARHLRTAIDIAIRRYVSGDRSAQAQAQALAGRDLLESLTAIALNAEACLQWLSRDVPALDALRHCASSILRDSRKSGTLIRNLHTGCRAALIDGRFSNARAGFAPS